MRRVVVTIPVKGLSKDESEVKVEGDGYKGDTCEERLKIFTSALGSELQTTPKPEYYEESTQTVKTPIEETNE